MRSSLRMKVFVAVVPLVLVSVVAVPQALANGSVVPNVAVTANPPASAPSDSVTYTATVSDPSATTTPTGTLTFTYKVTGPGGAFTFVLGSSTLQPVQTGSAVASITITPSSPPPSVNGGNPLPNGVVTITAAYSGDVTFAAQSSSTTDFIEGGCFTGQWPSETNGYPQVFAGFPQGYYIGQVNGWWSLYVAHPESGTKVKFTGAVVTSDRLIDVSATKNEAQDKVTQKGNGTLKFNFTVHQSLDGFTFYAGCGAKVTFRLAINGSAAPQSQINVGNPTTNPATNPLVYKRPN